MLAHPCPARSGPPSRSSPRDGPLAAALAAVGAALAAVVVYQDVLRGYFWSDDFSWLFVLHDGSLGEFLITPMGGHTLVARNALIALLDAVAGIDPHPWFATVLLTHALNVVLLARLVFLLTGRAVLAGVGALAWGICPAAGETLAWYAVYGQVAAVTCLLLGLGRVAVRVRQDAPLSGRDLIFVAGWFGLSSLFFGTALAIAVAWPLAVALLVPGSVRGSTCWGRVLAVSAVVCVLYGALQLLGWRTYESQVVPLQLLTWLGRRWWPAAVALAQLLRVGVTSTVLGTWWTPGPQSDAVSWITLALAATVSAVGVRRAPSRLRATLLAFGLFAVAIYGLIAVSRGPLAGPLFRQTSAQVGAVLRYHYAPQAFLVVALCAVLSALAPRRVPRGGELLAVGWGALLIAGQVRDGVDVDLHDASRAEVAQALQAIDARVAAVPPGEVAYVDNAPLAAFGWLPNTTEPPPGLAALFVITSPTDRRDGRVVRFIEPDPAVRAHAARRGGRTATLLVAPPVTQRPAISSSASTRGRSAGAKRAARSAARARSRSVSLRLASASMVARSAR
jgi:hypothetical protein